MHELAKVNDTYHPAVKRFNQARALRRVMTRRSTGAGFTLIELMITLMIAVIVITVGVPSFNEFIASQRARTTASDLMADMAFARAEAIKESRRAIMEPIGGPGTWREGWRICVDLNSDGDCDVPGEVRKAGTSVPGDPATTTVCATHADLRGGIIFRPDGRVVRSSAAGANDGIKIQIDVGADGVATNDPIRLVFFGVSGRASVEVQDKRGDSPACVP